MRDRRNIKNLTDEQLDTLVEANRGIYDAYMDLPYSVSLVKNVIDLIDGLYFRSKFIGFDPIPQRNRPDVPLIFASNHSGMAFPWDAIMFAAGYLRLNNFRLKDAVRPLTAPMLSQTTLMNPFLLPNFWKRAGAVDATMINFETMMRYRDSNLLIYPEGVPGIGKGFNRKYQLQKFSTSLLRMSIKYRTDIVPFATINGEYINPYTYSWDWFNRLTQKVGIPFIPIGLLTLLVPLQPWLFYCALPARLTYVLGDRIRPYTMIDKPFEEITQEELERLRDDIHGKMQLHFDSAVEAYGRQPYQMGDFWGKAIRQPGKFPWYLPFGWPFLFAAFEAENERTGAPPQDLRLNVWKLLQVAARKPLTLAYYLPILGWLPLLIRGYRNSKL